MIEKELKKETEKTDTKKQYIKIRGANEHNLKNVDLDIPRNELVVLTGLSGSGNPPWHSIRFMRKGREDIMESLSSYLQGNSVGSRLEKPELW